MSPHGSGFSAATLVSGLECAHWPLRSDVTMSQSQNGETLSHGRWQRAGTGVLLAAPAQGGWSRECCTSQLSADRRPEALGSDLCPVSWGPATLPAQKQTRGNTGLGADRLTFGQSHWFAERRSLVGRPLSIWRAQSDAGSGRSHDETRGLTATLSCYPSLAGPLGATTSPAGRVGPGGLRGTIPFSTWRGRGLKGDHAPLVHKRGQQGLAAQS